VGTTLGKYIMILVIFVLAKHTCAYPRMHAHTHTHTHTHTHAHTHTHTHTHKLTGTEREKGARREGRELYPLLFTLIFGIYTVTDVL